MAYKTLANGFFISVSACGFILAFLTVGRLVSFMSSIPSYTTEGSITKGTNEALWPLTVNISLLLLFMLQHSIMAKPLFKKALYSSPLHVVERSVYVIITSITLQCVMWYWQPIPWVAAWHIDTSGTFLWSLFTIAHACAWVVIYVGSLMMDIAEMLGVKQIYYHVRGLPLPLRFKSMELQRFYSHMRHPSFTGFCLLFWAYPIMSLDRLLLAIVWTLYMAVAWNVDHFDYIYQTQQFKRKQFEMENKKIAYRY